MVIWSVIVHCNQDNILWLTEWRIYSIILNSQYITINKVLTSLECKNWQFICHGNYVNVETLVSSLGKHNCYH